MAKVLQHRRGTTAEHENFVGAEGEITVDTEKHSIRVHDGVTAGGHALATDADLATVRATAEGALPKSGGTMTGTLLSNVENAFVRKGTDSRLVFMGGENWGGANIILIGKDASSNSGCAIVQASDGTQTGLLKLFPDGTAQLANKDILTSAGGTINGEFTVNMSGADKSITFVDGGYASGTNPSEARHRYFRVLDANKNILGDVGTSVNADGSVDTILRARKTASDGSKDTSTLKLSVQADGTNSIVFGDKNLVRSVNGTSADANGNVTVGGGFKQVSSVTVNVVPTSGTTVTKTVTVSGLTADKPVLLKFVADNSSYGYPRQCQAKVVSGLLAGPITGSDGSSGSNTTSDFPYVVNAQVAKNSKPTFVSSYPLLATSTSCSVSLYTHNVQKGNTYNITITAYQW